MTDFIKSVMFTKLSSMRRYIRSLRKINQQQHIMRICQNKRKNKNQKPIISRKLLFAKF